jgi:hypothetical protein
MSIDHFYSVKDGKATRLRREEIDGDALASADDVFFVRLNHGLNYLIDELYLFESRQEAQAFVGGGYKNRLFIGDDGVEDEPDYISPVLPTSSFFRSAASEPF